jgi:GC-rich sequence DNA-binding factor
MRSGMVDMIQDAEEEDEDEEAKEWEEAQIRRGQTRRGGSTQVSGSDRPERRQLTFLRSVDLLKTALQASSEYVDRPAYPLFPLNSSNPAAVPTPSTLPSLTGVSTRLTSALSTLEASHTLDAATLAHFSHERTELDAQEKELRTEVSQFEEKNRWFGDFKLFIEEVAAFLDEKVSPPLPVRRRTAHRRPLIITVSRSRED